MPTAVAQGPSKALASAVVLKRVHVSIETAFRIKFDTSLLINYFGFRSTVTQVVTRKARSFNE